MTKRNSAERAFSVNILARVAFSRLEFVKAWELYNSVPQITANLMERPTAKFGSDAHMSADIGQCLIL